VGGLGAGGASPSVAAAATGCQWQIPDYINIDQSNGWTLGAGPRAGFKYSAAAWHTGQNQYEDRMTGTLKLTRFDTSGSRPQVRFTVTWTDSNYRTTGGGVYNGTIDSDGFVSGTTYDKFHPSSRARFHFNDTIDCA
jgi:hypothetical protein